MSRIFTSLFLSARVSSAGNIWIETKRGKGFMVVRILMVTAFVGLCGCYQMSDHDDLRGIPVTNNPNVVPQHGGTISQLTAMQP